MAAADAKRIDPRRIALLLAQALGAIWTLPNTLAGTGGGPGGSSAAARAQFSDGALVFHKVRFGPAARSRSDR
jgi:hypothetical protein